MKKAGNKYVTVKTLANADHFMHATKTGGPRERFAKDQKLSIPPGMPTQPSNRPIRYGNETL